MTPLQKVKKGEFFTSIAALVVLYMEYRRKISLFYRINTSTYTDTLPPLIIYCLSSY